MQSFLIKKSRECLKIIKDVYRGSNSYRRGFQARINMVRDDEGNLTGDPVQVLKYREILSRNPQADSPR